MKFIGFIGLILMFGCGPTGNLSRQAPKVATLETCLQLYQENKWPQVLNCLEEIPDTGRNQAYFDLLGSTLMQSGRHREAIDAFQQAIDLDEAGQNLFLHFKMGQCLWQEHRYLDAGESIREYQTNVPDPRPDIKSQADYYLRSYTTADSLYHIPRTFDPVSLSDSINSEADELGLSMTYDRRHMILTRRTHQEDLYESHLKDGKWGEAKPLVALNSADNEGAASMAGDGELIVFTGCNRPDNVGSCDLYISTRSDTGWTSPQLLPVVNSRAWDSQPALSSDGRAIIFSSERPGGYGGRDLWLSVRNENGWIHPINLGPSVNSPGDEENPFLHSDENTLYFTSDYWPGFGGRDLFMTHRIKGNEWSAPRNLGFPVNSPDHEEGIFVESSGLWSYFSSARGDRFDLYSFELDPDIRPQPSLLYKMIAVNSETGQVLEGVGIDVFDWTNNRLVRRVTTDQEGFAAFLITGGRKYGITASRQDFNLFSYSITIESEVTQDLSDTLRLNPVSDTNTLVLENVQFETGEARLLPGSDTELDQLVDYLTDLPHITIRLTGHTDNVGTEEDNLTLSGDRAIAVKNYLTRRGIDSERITTEGMGESQPIADNDTEEGRQKNRRTEITIIR